MKDKHGAMYDLTEVNDVVWILNILSKMVKIGRDFLSQQEVLELPLRLKLKGYL